MVLYFLAITMTAIEVKKAIRCKASAVLNGIVADAYLGIHRSKKVTLFVKLMAVSRVMYEGMDCDVLTEIECWFKNISG